MEAEVIHVEFRKEKPKEENVYYCRKCDGGEFKLMSTGAVYCNGCGSFMRNLRVCDCPPERA